MAIGWLAVLKSVPWSDVISNAPLVADGARKLWKAVGRKPPAAAPAADAAPEAAGAAATQARVTELERAVSELNAQMIASSELIKALADQNTELIKRVESHRQRMLWLSVLLFAIAVAAVLALLLWLVRA